MNIGQLALTSGVSADTLRYYEKQGLLNIPARQANGYRQYGAADLERLRFVRGAQSLGFTLAEIKAVIPRLMDGGFGRADMEARLQAKMAEIDAHMRELRSLKRELQATFRSFTCASDTPMSMQTATRGAGASARPATE